MRKILFSIFLGVANLGHAQSVVAEHLSEVSAQDKANALEVVLTGTLRRDKRAPGKYISLDDDFRQLRDLCWQMRSLDLSGAHLDSVPANALHSRHHLQKVVLPANVKHIGSQAFFACDSLETLVVNAKVPPTVDAFAFGNIDLSKLKLIVPKKSRKAYKKAAGWSAFFGKSPNTLVLDPDLGRIPQAVPVSLIPIPAQLEELKGVFDPTHLGQIIDSPELFNEHEHLLRILQNRCGMKSLSGEGKARLSIDRSLPEEGYHLRAEGSDLTIVGGSPKGVFYGLMTLEQLFYQQPRCKAVDIADAPRTAMRELMVDPVRNWLPYEDLKDFIVEMARYKFNSLHIHLVDDQAWRIEIQAYPELTEKASFRVGMDDMLMPIGGYYTQEQMKELCRFAAKYHVTIIPEIEMPGHEVAAIHTFPWLTCAKLENGEVPIRTTCGVSNELLCPSSERTYEFLETVFRELAQVFPGQYIHLGGDEAGKPSLDCWTYCDRCQDLKCEIMGTDSLRSNREGNWRLQKYMFDRVIALLRDELGKTPMFWYETDFVEIQPGCIGFAWRDGLTQSAIDAAQRCDAKLMLCPGEHCYFDYPMGLNDMPEVNWGMPTTTLEQTYSLDPAWGNGSEFEEKCLNGVAGTLWSECINSTERLYYQAYPRALALAEAGWSPQPKRDYSDFLRRLAPITADMHKRGICVDY